MNPMNEACKRIRSEIEQEQYVFVQNTGIRNLNFIISDISEHYICRVTYEVEESY